MSDDRDNVIHVRFGKDGGRRISAPPPSETEPEAPGTARGRGRREDPLADLYSVSEVARVFGLKPSRLRSWDRSGFIQPSARDGRRRYYTFQDLIGLRVAKGLLDEGVPFRQVRRSVEALRNSLPRVARPLAELRVVADGQTVLVKGAEGAFEPTTGQLVLDFEVRSLRDDVVRVLKTHPAVTERRQAAYEHYLEGCRLDEDDATMDRAEEAYRRALELDPSLSNALTNLGNIRFRRGFAEEAEELYRKALAVDPSQPEAHYNLGFLYFESGEPELAADSFRQALAHDPAFADAHFNLAMAYEELGRYIDARPHWETYLQLDPAGPWAEIARRHLQRPKA